MEYLNKVLAFNVKQDDVDFKHLPNFIVARYHLQMAFMNKQKAIFLYPKTKLERIEVLKKHINRIQENENLPVVLVLKDLFLQGERIFDSRENPLCCRGKANLFTFYGNVFARTV